jgi:hypothetical protein
MSWVNYRSGGFGEVVDRFRWDAGCIAEHVRYHLIHPMMLRMSPSQHEMRLTYGIVGSRGEVPDLLSRVIELSFPPN